MNQITKKPTSKLVSIQTLKTFNLHEYSSNNKLSKIVNLLIKRLFLRRASPKTKITVHFIVNIAIYESLLFEGYLCKRLQTPYTY